MLTLLTDSESYIFQIYVWEERDCSYIFNIIFGCEKLKVALNIITLIPDLHRKYIINNTMRKGGASTVNPEHYGFCVHLCYDKRSLKIPNG
jgi:hypothetical protein